VWALIAFWVYPRLLDFVGGESVAQWLLDHTWVRVLGIPPLGLLGLISAFEPINPRKRAARQELAAEVGGTLVELGDLDTMSGIPDGPGLRVPLGRWSMVVTTWTRKGDVRTVASVRVKTLSPFSFVARGSGREPKMMRNLQQFAVAHSLRHMTKHAKDPRVAAAATSLGYLTEPPITTGDDALDRTVVLRADVPDTARALLTAAGMPPAIAELNAKTRRWDWTFYPTSVAGVAEMRLECPGTMKDSDTLRVVQALMKAALEKMDRAGVIESQDSRNLESADAHH
jgi:hypothetical protein